MQGVAATLALALALLVATALVADALPLRAARALAGADTAAERAEAVATALFNGGEHWRVGDEAWALFKSRLPNGGADAAADLAGVETQLSQGQRNCLFADLYAALGKDVSRGFKRPCKPLNALEAAGLPVAPDSAANFLANHHALHRELTTNQAREATQLLAWIRLEHDAVAAAKARGSTRASTDAYKKLGDVRAQIGEDAITQGNAPDVRRPKWLPKAAVSAMDQLHAVFKQGRFMKLANVNVDHFAPCNELAYAAGHRAALAEAAKGTREGLVTAMHMEAEAMHFLQDHFAAGHVRAPRGLANTRCGRSFGPLMVKAMHDEENYFGLRVRNDRGDRWVAYGDTRLEDDDNRSGKTLLLEACAAGYAEVYAAFRTRTAARDSYEALSFVPHDDPAAQPPNHPPMLKASRDGTRLYYRKKSGPKDKVRFERVSTAVECGVAPLLKLRMDAELKAGKLENGDKPKPPLALTTAYPAATFVAPAPAATAPPTAPATKAPKKAKNKNKK